MNLFEIHVFNGCSIGIKSLVIQFISCGLTDSTLLEIRGNNKTKYCTVSDLMNLDLCFSATIGILKVKMVSIGDG